MDGEKIFSLFNWLIFIPFDHESEAEALFGWTKLLCLVALCSILTIRICLIEQTEMGIHVIYSLIGSNTINRSICFVCEENCVFCFDGFIKATHDIIIHAHSVFFLVCSLRSVRFFIYEAETAAINTQTTYQVCLRNSHIKSKLTSQLWM